jgi:flagellar biosynthesis/type III secretory pathway chaperone
MSAKLQAEADLALIATIEEMDAGVGELQAVLQSERQALCNADIDGIHHAGAQKRDIIERLEQLDLERISLIKLAPTTHASLAESWAEFLQRLSACNDLNQANGILVNERLKMVRSALAILTGNEPNSGIYGPGGGQFTPLRGKASIAV